MFTREIKSDNNYNYVSIRGYNPLIEVMTNQYISFDGNEPYTMTDDVQMSINSTSVNDTLTGSGAGSVKILGINENWYNQAVTVDLDGQTAVNISPNFIRINDVEIITSNDGANDHTNDGVITVYSDNNDIVKQIPQQVNFSAYCNRQFDCFYTVPRLYRLWVTKLFYDSTDSNNLYLNMFSRKIGVSTTKPPQLLFSATEKGKTYQFDALVIEAGTDLWCEGGAPDGNCTNVTCYIEGILQYTGLND